MEENGNSPAQPGQGIPVNPNLVAQFLKEELSNTQMELAQWKALAEEQAQQILAQAEMIDEFQKKPVKKGRANGKGSSKPQNETVPPEALKN